MKRTLLLILILLPMLASADAIEIDGICYNLNSEAKTAEVTSNPQKYLGDITIPESVEHKDITYSVTSIGGYAFYLCKELTSNTSFMTRCVIPFQYDGNYYTFHSCWIGDDELGNKGVF